MDKLKSKLRIGSKGVKSEAELSTEKSTSVGMLRVDTDTSQPHRPWTAHSNSIVTALPNDQYSEAQGTGNGTTHDEVTYSLGTQQTTLSGNAQLANHAFIVSGPAANHSNNIANLSRIAAEQVPHNTNLQLEVDASISRADAAVRGMYDGMDRNRIVAHGTDHHKNSHMSSAGGRGAEDMSSYHIVDQPQMMAQQQSRGGNQQEGINALNTNAHPEDRRAFDEATRLRTASQQDQYGRHQQLQTFEPFRGANTSESYGKTFNGRPYMEVRPSEYEKDLRSTGDMPLTRINPVQTYSENIKSLPNEDTDLRQRLRKAMWLRINSRYPHLQKLDFGDEPRRAIEFFINTSRDVIFDEIIAKQASIHSLEQRLTKTAQDLAQQRELREAETKQHHDMLQEIKWRHGSKIEDVRHERENALWQVSQQHKKELSNTEARHKDQVRYLSQQHQEMIDRKTLEQSDYVKRLLKEHEQTVMIRKKEQSYYVDQLRQAHRDDLARKDQELLVLEQTYEIEKDRLARAHQDELNELNCETIAAEDRMATEVKRLKDEHQKQVERYQEEIDQAAQKHEAALFVSAQKQEEREAQLTAEHALKLKSLKREVEGLSAALLARDNETYTAPLLNVTEGKRDPDEHIKTQFMELVQLVDDLGRLEWKDNQKVWTEQVLRNLGPDQNQRLLKKHILQDLIWTILHQLVYCSPFRVFGKEGQILEKQWNERCGQDPSLDNGVYTWPKPGIEIERWRYVTVTECRKALMQPIPSEWDPRAKLKKGFKTSSDSLISELKSSLSEIVAWDSADLQKVERLAKRMSNLWLEFGMYRCRILLSLPGSKPGSAADKARRAQKGSLELVIVPSLGRYGNVKGFDLDNFAVIGGYTGESVKLP